ncbi:hypothetical protein GTW71_32030 [Streptomyces sp. SID6041]|nr:hypothetical protein [Streptomyces sp. SID6041]
MNPVLAFPDVGTVPFPGLVRTGEREPFKDVGDPLPLVFVVREEVDDGGRRQAQFLILSYMNPAASSESRRAHMAPSRALVAEGPRGSHERRRKGFGGDRHADSSPGTLQEQGRSHQAMSPPDDEPRERSEAPFSDDPFSDQHPGGTEIGDYVRFVLVLAARDDEQTLMVTEMLTDAYWRGTARGAPTGPRALHLLGQMLARVGGELTRSHAQQ